MISRYNYVDKKKNSKGKQVLETFTIPNIPERENDIYIITNVADRLDSLAYQYYGNAKYWWIIAAANNLGKGSIFMEAGIQLRIPANPSTVITETERQNNRL